MIIGFLIIFCVYLLINAYPAHRALSWLKAIWRGFDRIWIKIIYYILYMAAAAMPLVGLILPAGKVQTVLSKAGYYVMGFVIYLVLVLLAFDLLRGLGRVTNLLKKRWVQNRVVQIVSGALVLLTVSGIVGYGCYHARQLQTKEYEVAIDKTLESSDGITVALISDLHFGCNIGAKQFRMVVDTVNDMNADLICIAGDIFDSGYDAVEEPEKLISMFRELKSTYGVYACFGNHDVARALNRDAKSAQTDNRMEEFLEQAGVKLLQDEAVMINYQFYLVGRRDARPLGSSNNTRKSANLLLTDLNRNLPVLVMDHQPSDLKSLSDSGADLVMSGHTHNGQLFPGNLLVGLLNDNAYGYYRDGRMQSIVTSGAGLWGPYMRVGTDCEVVKIHVKWN